MRLTLVHVLAPPRMPVSAAGGAPPAALLPRVADDARAAREMLDATARSVLVNAGGSSRLRVLEGPVGPQIAHVAADERAALIALGASDRGSLAAALAGSASLHVLRRSAHPVMVCQRHVGLRA
jgi:nucleotide-binding universal stress UspA family protein